MIYKGNNDEYLELSEQNNTNRILFDKELSYPLLMVWVKGENSEINFEGTTHQLENNTILCLTAFHNFEFKQMDFVRMIKFNREFYCVLDHDNEVSCKGLLFYGANQLPFFTIPTDEIEKFETLWRMFQIEMQSKDDLQLEMLQMMLKRFIILSTRMYKSQINVTNLKIKDADIVREFNFLVEKHFKTKHTVKEYADLLHKSSKTLSNIFSQLAGKSPLQIIHERKLLEAQRMLKYTDKPIKEIAFELGFEDIQTFSRFFKKLNSNSPSVFRNSHLGNIANSSGVLP